MCSRNMSNKKVSEASRGKRFQLLGGVLAGGASSRMGHDKATLTLPDGSSCLQHVSNQVDSVCECTAISCARGSLHSSIASKLDRVTDPDAHRGPITGIVALLEHAERLLLPGVLVVPVDLPTIEAQDLRALCEAFEADTTQIVAASFDASRSEPLVAIYPTFWLTDLQRLAAGEDRSVARWLNSVMHRRVNIRADAGVELNTPEQWQEFYGKDGSDYKNT